VRKAARWIVRVLAAIGFLFLAVTFTPVNFWWTNQLAGAWNDPVGRVLIVPGADAVQGSIGFSSYWRSVYAVRAWKQGGFQTVVVCGGGENGQASTAEQMRDFVVAEGIPAAAVRVETVSGSTRENALKSKPLLDQLPGTKVLLTSDYHMFRAYRVFRKAGIDVTPSPFPDAIKQSMSRLNRWPVFLGLCMETGKIAYYFIRGWI
jgi:uncharacterized SAM-binding protein YcdF (DUF218 family)